MAEERWRTIVTVSHTVALFQHAQHAMTARIPTTQGNSQYSLCCYTLRSLYGILRASCCKECKLVSEPVSRHRCTASDSRCAKVYRTIGPLTFASIPDLPAQYPSRSLLHHSGVPSVAPSVCCRPLMVFQVNIWSEEGRRGHTADA